MKQFEADITNVMKFLEAESFSTSVISEHRYATRKCTPFLRHLASIIPQRSLFNGPKTTRHPGPNGGIQDIDTALTSWKMSV